MVPPKGPSLARSTSTWIHWSSPVASAKSSTRCWVISTQSVTPISWPATASSSAKVVKVRTRRFPCINAWMLVMEELTRETIRRVPKVLLHDHLDGGLRPATIVELAAETGYEGLPTSDAGQLAAWMGQVANRGSLELYLEAFQHTVGVMQTRDALIRVAAECAEDLAADGVVYAEVRFAPELHLGQGLSLDQVVEAVLEGFRRGSSGRR